MTQIYCLKHDDVHNLKPQEMELAIYVLQYRVAEAALSRPLPQTTLTENIDTLMRGAFCVMEDVDLGLFKYADHWASHVDRMARQRDEILKARRAKAQKARDRAARMARIRATRANVSGSTRSFLENLDGI